MRPVRMDVSGDVCDQHLLAAFDCLPVRPPPFFYYTRGVFPEWVEGAWFQLLKLTCDELLSSVAFIFSAD